MLGAQLAGMTRLATSFLPDSLVTRSEKGACSRWLESILQMDPQDSRIGAHDRELASIRSTCTTSPSPSSNSTSTARYMGLESCWTTKLIVRPGKLHGTLQQR